MLLGSEQGGDQRGQPGKDYPGLNRGGTQVIR